MVGTDDRHGSSWSLQTGTGTDDVYLAHREGGRWVHTSLHHDGRWHLAVTPAGQELVPGTPPYLAVTLDHQEIAAGWLHAVRITVAAAELRSDWRESVRHRNTIDVSMPQDTDAISIDVLLGEAGASTIQIDRALMIAMMARAGGGILAVIARPTELDVPVKNALAQQIAQAIGEAQQFGWDGASTTRIVVFGGDADGYFRHVEVALDPIGETLPSELEPRPRGLELGPGST